MAEKMTAKDVQQAFEAAAQRFREGDRLGAEQVVHDAVRRAAAEAGSDSHLYAQALFNEASLLAGIGDMARAVAACRQAAAVPARDQAARKDRLTYLMNLGELLSRIGQPEEAEKVLRESLQERKQFYGAEHPGYAFGLASLAETLLARGETAEALERIDEAVAINQKSGHEKALQDLALRAFIIKAEGGPAAQALECWAELPPPARTKLARHCFDRAAHGEQGHQPGPALAVLRELQGLLAAEPQSDQELALDVLVRVSNLARVTGDHAIRVAASREVVERCAAAGDHKNLILAYQGLAHALSQTGQKEETEKSYRAALEKAEAVNDSVASANVLRNYALWVADERRTEEADGLHQKAVAAAGASGDAIMHGRSLAAYGIFSQHKGETQKASALLEQALRLLPAAHPDAFYAQNHLTALRQGQTCGCGHTDDEALSALLLRLVRRNLGPDLLKDIRVKMSPDKPPDVSVELAREPSQQELEQVNRVVNQALAEMRQQYQRAGYGR